MDAIEAGGSRMFTDDHLRALYKRIVNLESQVANQALLLKTLSQFKDAQTLSSTPIKSHVVSQTSSSRLTDMKEQAAQQQATNHLYAPLRGDVASIMEMKAFIERFLSMDDLGLSVPACVRDDARVALGRARVES